LILRIVSRLADEVHCGCKGNTFLRDFWVLQIKSLIANRLNKGIPGRSKPQNTPIFSELLTSGVKVGLIPIPTYIKAAHLIECAAYCI
jgi:hypothetical protein